MKVFKPQRLNSSIFFAGNINFEFHPITKIGKGLQLPVLPQRASKALYDSNNSIFYLEMWAAYKPCIRTQRFPFWNVSISEFLAKLDRAPVEIQTGMMTI